MDEYKIFSISIKDLDLLGHSNNEVIKSVSIYIYRPSLNSKYKNFDLLKIDLWRVNQSRKILLILDGNPVRKRIKNFLDYLTG